MTEYFLPGPAVAGLTGFTSQWLVVGTRQPAILYLLLSGTCVVHPNKTNCR